MAPHLHNVPQGSSKSTGEKAIKDKDLETSNRVLPSKSTGGKGKAIMNKNREKSVEVFTRSTPNHNPTTPAHIHPEDIKSFTQFGFNEHAKQLAIQSGFQVAMIEGVYKHVSNFKQTKKFVKAMHTAALEQAKIEIEGQEMEDLYENAGSGSEDEVANAGSEKRIKK
ncbi:hypothetical protein F4604DRAFT_1681338 [Suillus subluteus]|nr:hypothetical protein F4604DRAFT_1681338 [Suillus subluteus]